MYDEVDIKKILARATELQNLRRGPDTGPVSGSGQKLTLKEIEEIAQELDLSPEFVREAALEYEGIPNKEPLFLDTGTNHEVELMGHANGTLDQKTWAELRALVEYHFDCPGQVTRRPLGIQWEARPKGILKFLQTRKSPRVEIKSTGETSTIRIRQNLKTVGKLMYPGYAALIGAVLFVGGAMAAEEPGMIFASAALLAVAKLFHYWTNKRKQKARRQLTDLMDQLQTIITRRYAAAEKSKETDEEVSREAGKQIEVETENEDAFQQENTPSSASRKKVR